MATDFYRDRLDGVLTIDIDANANRWLEIGVEGYFTPPIVGVTAQTPVAENSGGAVTITGASIVTYTDEPWLRFKASGFGPEGSSATVAFRISFGEAETDDLTIRFRSTRK